MEGKKREYGYDRCSGRSEIAPYAKGCVYLMYPPYTKETTYDKTGSYNKEWKKHYYMIMTEPNFQGYVQVMQLTSTPEPRDGFPIGLPVNMSINDKNGRLRCDGVWSVHYTHFKVEFFTGVYVPNREIGIPLIHDFTRLCFDLYMVINQVISYKSERGRRIMDSVEDYIQKYEKWHAALPERPRAMSEVNPDEITIPIEPKGTAPQPKPTVTTPAPASPFIQEPKPIPVVKKSEPKPEPLHIPDEIDASVEKEEAEIKELEKSAEKNPPAQKCQENETQEKETETIIPSVKVVPVKESSLDELFSLISMENLCDMFKGISKIPNQWKDKEIALYMFVNKHMGPTMLQTMTGYGPSTIQTLTASVKKIAVKRKICDKHGYLQEVG